MQSEVEVGQADDALDAAREAGRKEAERQIVAWLRKQSEEIGRFRSGPSSIWQAAEGIAALEHRK